MKRKFVLIIIFCLGLAVRLYRVNAPLADWHSFRQADTASVAREFVENGYNLLKPRYHDLSNIQSGQPNPDGYRMVEFPLYNALHAGFYQVFGTWMSFESAGRMVSIIASLLSGYLLFLIVKNETNWLVGTLTAGFFLFLPFNIYYSRTILPGPLMTMLSLGSIYFFSVSPSSWFSIQNTIALVLGALAILVKPYAIFLLIPSYLVIGIKKINLRNLLRVAGYEFIIISPFLAWRFWIKQFPAGIPVNQWLLNQNNIRLRPAWWRWLFGERLGKLILGYWGLIPFGIGLIYSVKAKFNWLFYSLFGGIFAYFVVFAWGNVQHDYYQIIAVPVVSIFLAKGVYFLLHPPKNINFFPSLLLLVSSLIFSFGFSWYQIREYYKINQPEIITAGNAVDNLVPKNAKVIAPYQGDTAFLYQTKRRGWPAVTRDVEDLIEMGAEYYVSVNYDQTTAELKERCQIIEENDDFVIINLNQCSKATR